MKLVLASALSTSLILLAACAAQPRPPPAETLEPATNAAPYDPETVQELKTNAKVVALAPTSAESEIVCQREVPTGSHIARRRCYTKAALRRQTEEAQEWLRSRGRRGSINVVK